MHKIVRSRSESHDRTSNSERCKSRICMALDFLMKQSFHPEVIKEFSGEKLLLEILTLYYSWKRIHGTKTYEKKFEKLVIYHMAKVCTYWNVTNSSLVAEVLNCIFHSEGHFSFIFYHENMLSIEQWPLSPDQVDLHSIEYHRVSYFLYHANKVRTTFCGTRFVDRCLEYPSHLAPCFLAAISGKSDLLLLILQYGAAVISKPGMRSFRDNFQTTDLYIVLERLISRLKNLENVEFDYLHATLCSENAQQIILCMKLLLRASGQLCKRSLERLIYLNDETNDFIHRLIDNGILTILKNRFFEPCKLKHLTRDFIRKILNENWQLPFGIGKLSLSLELQSYLNLLED